uniref:Uncharacterized mitochondrial protein AtMg00810-like n=1 Tax=Nicotiana tabacum TaxID=4097 RepID=A0A1S4D3N3_TOBAC|nr:PREDICTED: uncharacterized mitochondrial protein AtMg00810-like [Nicotiana tabacum]
MCKLNKSLHGLKEASRQWYAKLIEALCSRGYIHSIRQWYAKLIEALCFRGYIHSMFDYSLFYKGKGNSVAFVAVYVVDVIIIGAHLEEITSLKKFLHETFRIKRSGQTSLLPRRNFTQDLLKEFDCTWYSVVTSPLDSTVKLKAGEWILLPDPSHYRKLIGKLNFLIGTRPDIAYIVQHLSQYMQSPTDSHLKAAAHVLRYFKGNLSLGSFLSNNRDYRVRAFRDSDWARPINWKSKKQSTISLSSAEAEYRAVRKVVGELIWLARLLEELTIPLSLPIHVLCDSQATLHIVKNQVFHERTKHIEVDCQFVSDKLQDGLISLHYIPTHEPPN